MNVGTPIPQYAKAESVPDGSIYIAEMGDGSGTKGVTQETLTKEIGERLKTGNTEDLKTNNKKSIVEAINEIAESGGSGSSMDILDTKEEIEANTGTGKIAGAQAVKEMFSEISNNMGGYTFGETEDGQPGFRKPGADTVTPFNAGEIKGTFNLSNPYGSISEFTIRSEKYQTLSVTIISNDDFANGYLVVYGDDSLLENIKDYKVHTYDISTYNTISMRSVYAGGGGTKRLKGEYTIS